MIRYQFSLAESEDDEALRLRMAEDVMQGSVSVSFRRSPSYFAGSALQGKTVQVIACKDAQNDRVVGMGTRAILPSYVNGDELATGYLCDLRGDASVRGGMLLARGYRYLKQLHNANPIPLYYSMILDGNESVLNLLGSERANLPCYRPAGKFNTPAILLGGRRRHRIKACTHIRCAQAEDIDTILHFVNTSNSRFQFAPVFERADFTNGRLSGLAFNDIYLAWQDELLVGVCACWDQAATRQIHIEKYSAMLNLLKPVYNTFATVSSYKRLPAPGQSLACLYLCLTAIQHDDTDVFTDLLEHIYAVRRTGHWQVLFAGLHESHPLNSSLERFRSISAAGQFFVVHWPEDQAAYDQLDSRIPHVEIGGL